MSGPSGIPTPARLGLALSSGAARGAAHVGVLQALEDAGIPIDVVVGTSAGALIGVGWAAGFTAAEVTDRTLRAGWADFGDTRPNARLGLVDTTALRASIDEALGGRAIEDFPRRFGAVATDVLTRTPVLLDHGSAAEAVCASIAVPGIFPPVTVDGRTLVDGVLTAPMPVWAARRLGADAVVAVRLRPADPSRTHPRSLRNRVVPIHREGPPAEVEILVDTRGYSSWSPRDVPALIELGRRSTEQELERIVQLLDHAARRTTTSRSAWR